MKIVWKSKKVILTTVTAVLLLVGVAHPQVVASAVTELVCGVTECAD